VWCLRFLNGPQAGKVFSLKPGRNTIGRASHCDIQISLQGISKEHCQIIVTDHHVELVDLGSSNGTFVNGVRIQKIILQVTDKVGVHQLLFQVLPQKRETKIIHTKRNENSVPGSLPPSTQWSATSVESAAGSLENQESVAVARALGSNSSGNLQERIQRFIDEVALPGVYQLSHVTDVKYVFAGMIGIFILVVTLLTTIPMQTLSTNSAFAESQRRALTIARVLAKASIVTGNSASLMSSSSAQIAMDEDGVKEALIVSKDNGSVLFPADRQGTTPNYSFVHVARKQNKEFVDKISSTLIGASVPIATFNASIGAPEVKSYAMVIYDTESLNFDDGRVLGLFIQSLFISSLSGLILLFFIYKLAEYPIKILNTEMDKSLKDQQHHFEVPIKMDAIHSFITNINAFVARTQNQDQAAGVSGYVKEAEIHNLVQLIGYSSLAVNQSMEIIAMNHAFEQLFGVHFADKKNQPLINLGDQAFLKNVQSLCDQSQHQTTQSFSDNIEIGGLPHVIHCQGMTGTGHQAEYYILTLYANTHGGGHG
jgi:hypothetical protein